MPTRPSHQVLLVLSFVFGMFSMATHSCPLPSWSAQPVGAQFYGMDMRSPGLFAFLGGRTDSGLASFHRKKWPASFFTSSASYAFCATMNGPKPRYG